MKPKDTDRLIDATHALDVGMFVGTLARVADVQPIPIDGDATSIVRICDGQVQWFVRVLSRQEVNE